MPLRRLPSLTALRAFEAAARLGSFKAAAQELSVTPGAISQSVRALEEDLGVALFHRTTRAVSLTEEGQVLHPDVTRSFLCIQQAVDRVATTGTRRLTINSTPPLITKLLLPRLPRFTADHPEVDISIETEFDLNALQSGGPDVVIRVTRQAPDHVHAIRLFDEVLLPVASPALIERLSLETPADLRRAPLLTDTSMAIFEGAPDWEDWFEAARVDAPDLSRGVAFERRAADYVVDLAISGAGVLLARSSICHSALSAGLLVCPFGPALRTDVGVYVMCRHEIKAQPHVRAFLGWMKSEAALVTTLNALVSAA